MNRKILLNLFIVIILLFPSLSFADDKAIADWTQKTLIETLSLKYTGNEDLYRKMHPCFTYNAWSALNDFFENYIDTVNDEKLILHPQPIGPASIIASGIVKKSNFFAGVKYWKVNQNINIPELALRINFSVLVIAKRNGEYVITSLDMILQ